jgi:hypothetical protein
MQIEGVTYKKFVDEERSNIENSIAAVNRLTDPRNVRKMTRAISALPDTVNCFIDDFNAHAERAARENQFKPLPAIRRVSKQGLIPERSVSTYAKDPVTWITVFLSALLGAMAAVALLSLLSRKGNKVGVEQIDTSALVTPN